MTDSTTDTGAEELGRRPTAPAPAAAPATAAPKPSMGRIVIYNHAATKYDHHSAPSGSVTATQSPAMIQAVNPDGTLRLIVFGPFAMMGHTGMELILSATLANPKIMPPVPGTWQWPTRV